MLVRVVGAYRGKCREDLHECTHTQHPADAGIGANGVCNDAEHGGFERSEIIAFRRPAIAGEPLSLHPAGLTRPAPAEPPQGRNAARIGGCSGAM